MQTVIRNYAIDIFFIALTLNNVLDLYFSKTVKFFPIINTKKFRTVITKESINPKIKTISISELILVEAASSVAVF